MSHNFPLCDTTASSTIQKPKTTPPSVYTLCWPNIYRTSGGGVYARSLSNQAIGPPQIFSAAQVCYNLLHHRNQELTWPKSTSNISTMTKAKQASLPTPNEDPAADDQPPIEVYKPEDAPTEKPKNLVLAGSEKVQENVRIIRFRNRAMIEVAEPYEHFIPLTREMFDPICYSLLPGITRSKVADIFAYTVAVAQDLTQYDRYIGFGFASDQPHEQRRVWDTLTLSFTGSVREGDTVWRSPWQPAASQKEVPYVLELAGGDHAIYADIMQSLAPIIMDTKPDGVIWWVGDGANGKSTLMDAVYRIFPGQLASLTVKRLVEEKDTPGLNGTLANVVKESSEGRLDDTEIYKAIGTHEDFQVHKFHSQDSVTVKGNLHHIFSANNIPTMNDKGFSARRRTFIVPFTQRFESDPEFEKKTFKRELFEQLLGEMIRYALSLRRQRYTYKWSAQALSAKLDYDSEANTAEEFGRELVDKGVVAFDNFRDVQREYENWCADTGYVPLGMNNLRRAMKAVQFERRSIRVEGRSPIKRYVLKSIEVADMRSYGMGMMGLYTKAGFQSDRIDEPTELNPDPQPVQEPLPMEEDEQQPGRRDREDGWG